MAQFFGGQIFQQSSTQERLIKEHEIMTGLKQFGTARGVRSCRSGSGIAQKTRDDATFSFTFFFCTTQLIFL